MSEIEGYAERDIPDMMLRRDTEGRQPAARYFFHHERNPLEEAQE